MLKSSKSPVALKIRSFLLLKGIFLIKTFLAILRFVRTTLDWNEKNLDINLEVNLDYIINDSSRDTFIKSGVYKWSNLNNPIYIKFKYKKRRITNRLKKTPTLTTY